jgi:histone H1/5
MQWQGKMTGAYKAGIVEAITALKDRTGSSSAAIKKFMQEKMGDKKWQNATFLSALKSGTEAGDFVKTKNSYKLSADYKKKAVAAAKKKAAPPKEKKEKAEKPKKKATSAKKKTTEKVRSTYKKSYSEVKLHLRRTYRFWSLLENFHF